MFIHKMKQNKFHSFKIRLAHKLNEDDFDRCVEFYEIIIVRIDTDSDFFFRIILSDEATFQLNSILNSQ